MASGGMVNLQPRVNGAMVPDHVGQNVTLIGQVKDQTNTSAVTVTASDQHDVTVNMDDAVKPDQLSTFIEVVAQVSSPTEVRALVVVNLDDNFHMDNYNEAVTLMAKFPGPFTK
eukprot:m.440791 g.440791  ORF g.440791 m.440791 type:complete len:114 (+) comp18567_c0_seq1:85-426(+)